MQPGRSAACAETCRPIAPPGPRAHAARPEESDTSLTAPKEQGREGAGALSPSPPSWPAPKSPHGLTGPSSPSAATAEKSPLRESVEAPAAAVGLRPLQQALRGSGRNAGGPTALSAACLFGLLRPAPGAGVQSARKAAKLAQRFPSVPRPPHALPTCTLYPPQSPPPGPDWARPGLRVLIGGARCSSLPPRAASLEHSLAR